MMMAYLQDSPFTSKQSENNERAYEMLMDVRMKLLDLTYEIDRNHDEYMRFMQQTLDSPDLMARVCAPLKKEEKNLVELELMIMEQVADWEIGEGKVAPESEWNKVTDLVVSLPNGKTQTIRMAQEVQRRSWFGLCPISYKIGSLKMCGGCKLIGYFGKDEQKADWPDHKVVCKAITSLTKKAGGCSHITEKISGDHLVEGLANELGRALKQEELDMCHYPRVCGLCGKGGGKQEQLRNCSRCHCITWCHGCLEKGKEKHEEWCHLLKTAMEDYKHEKTIGHQVQKYTPTFNDKFAALPDSIENLFEKEVGNLVSNKLPGYQDSELRYLTFLYTCPLTVLHAAEQSGLASGPVENAKSLTIHLVGARIAEVRHLIGWEILALRLPSLKKLHIVLIGDECMSGNFPPTFTYKSVDAQNKMPDLEIRYSFEPPQLYQDYVKTPKYSVPDMTVALDAGFKFYPTWDPCIPHMLPAPGVPCVFTEFTLQDQKDNLAKVSKLVGEEALEMVVAPKRNPFCSRRPVRCSDKSGNYVNNSVIFSNDYICVVKRK